ncbi:MAG: hypothetical protein R3E39_18995 [Anaerolineae bacterium]
MPFQISWYIEKRVILAQFLGDITLQEAEEASAKVATLVEFGEGPLVHLIADASGMQKFPTQLSLLNGGASQHLRNPKLGWTIVIGSNGMIRFVSSIMTQVTRVRFRMLPSIEQGIAFLAEQDGSLKELIEMS